MPIRDEAVQGVSKYNKKFIGEVHIHIDNTSELFTFRPTVIEGDFMKKNNSKSQLN